MLLQPEADPNVHRGELVDKVFEHERKRNGLHAAALRSQPLLSQRAGPCKQGCETLTALAMQSGFLQRYSTRRRSRFFGFRSVFPPSSSAACVSSATTSEMVVSVDIGARRSPQVTHSHDLS